MLTEKLQPRLTKGWLIKKNKPTKKQRAEKKTCQLLLYPPDNKAGLTTEKWHRVKFKTLPVNSLAELKGTELLQIRDNIDKKYKKREQITDNLSQRNANLQGNISG